MDKAGKRTTDTQTPNSIDEQEESAHYTPVMDQMSLFNPHYIGKKCEKCGAFVGPDGIKCHECGAIQGEHLTNIIVIALLILIVFACALGAPVCPFFW